ncbi:MAG: hypothetical protein ACRDLK_10475 [Gaiellaceae bacterium]
MRRVLVTVVVLLALGIPAAASAHLAGPDDGTLVIKGADNGDGIVDGARPVVTLVIQGFVIGKVTGQGRIEIYYDTTASSTPEVTGAATHQDVQHAFKDNPVALDGTQWTGTNFTFRAVQGTYRVMIWGSGVYLFAGGNGRVWMTGQPGDPSSDGQYSVNGGDWHSLPFSGGRQITANAAG